MPDETVMADPWSLGLEEDRSQFELARRVIQQVPLSNARICVDPSIAVEVAERGIDHLAWYSSPHTHPPARSGIWIREQGVHWAAQSLSGSAQPEPHEIHAAFLIILAHECFHAIVDRTLTHASSWLSAHHGTAVNAYSSYQALPEVRTADEPLEEALANAFALQQCVLSQPAFEASVIADWMTNTQPDGYRHFATHLGPAFATGLRELARRAVAAAAPRAPAPASSLDLERLLEDHISGFNPLSVPTYLIADLPHPLDASLPRAEIPARDLKDLERHLQTLQQHDGDLLDVIRTTPVQLRLKEVEAAGGRLRGTMERIDGWLHRSAQLASRGVPVIALSDGRSLAIPDTARAITACGAVITALGARSKTWSSDLRWGENHPDESQKQTPEAIEAAAQAIEAVGAAADRWVAKAADAPPYAARLW